MDWIGRLSLIDGLGDFIRGLGMSLSSSITLIYMFFLTKSDIGSESLSLGVITLDAYVGFASLK